MSQLIAFDTGWNKVNYAVITFDNRNIDITDYKQINTNVPRGTDSDDEYISRVTRAHMDIARFIQSDFPEAHWAFIEKPIYVNNGETLIKLSIAATALFCTLTELQVDCTFVNNVVWKKAVVGNGRARKEEIAKKAIMYLSMDKLPIGKWDLYDAALIGFYATMYLKERTIKERDMW